MGEQPSVHCCIAGGGPAGQMLALLLARYGLEVRVLEKHADFLRDFRGDTIHPSTMKVMEELGLLEAFLKLPHQKVERVGGQFGGEPFVMADLRHLATPAPYIAMLPQWDFLNFLRTEAERYPGYRLHLRTEATGLLWEDGRVVGVTAEGPEGPLHVRAKVTIAADGRGSVLRQSAGLQVEDLGAPMDVLWFRLSRDAHDPGQTMGLFDRGRILVLIDRGSHWQIAFVIPKGGIDRLKDQGLPAFLSILAEALPLPTSRLSQLSSWDDIKLLTVKVDRLQTWWKPGFLAIGDAAHAMSPIGGVGINLAIQDAVAAANRVAPALELGDGALDEALAEVQAHRQRPTELTQRLQVLLQDRLIVPTLSARPVRMPKLLRLLQWLPPLQRIPARFLGVGFQPEHVSNALRYAAER